MSPECETRDETFAAVLGSGGVAVGACGVDVLAEARGAIERRRSAGLHDGMAFTYRNPARSTDPTRALPSARSAVVAAFPYRTQRRERPEELVAEVARYAAADTYQRLREALRCGAEVLGSRGHRAVVLADDNALVDRALAARAGLGWLGKNTNLLVDGVGSWVVIGSILTDADLPAGALLRSQRGGLPEHDQPDPIPERGCGSCTRCLTACPTNALVAPGVMDSSRCLSWLLQRTGEFPRGFRVALGARIYGCDDCQEACPPSRMASVSSSRPEVPGVSETPEAADDPGDWVALRDLLTMSDTELLERFGAWYIPRRDPRYLRRNALVVLGNVAAGRSSLGGGVGSEEAADVRDLLCRYLGDEDPLLVQHAAWAARRAGADHLLWEGPWRDHPEVLAEVARPHPRVEVPRHDPPLATAAQRRDNASMHLVRKGPPESHGAPRHESSPANDGSARDDRSPRSDSVRGR